MLRDRGRWYARLLGRHIAAGDRCSTSAAPPASGSRASWTAAGAGRGVEPNADDGRARTRATGARRQTGTLETLLESAERFDLVAHDPGRGALRRPAAGARAAARRLRARGASAGRDLGPRELDRAGLRPTLARVQPAERAALVLAGEPAAAWRAASVSARSRAAGPGSASAARHAKSLLRYKLGTVSCRRAISIVPDRLSVPYPFDDLFWMLLRIRDERG